MAEDRSRTIPDELLTVVQGEPFRIFLEQEAERRITAALKRLCFPAVPLLALLAFFGWKGTRLYDDLVATKREVEQAASAVKSTAAAVAEQSRSAAEALQRVENSAVRVDRSAQDAERSAHKVVGVEGQIDALSRSMSITASLGSETAQKLLSAATTSRTELQDATTNLNEARSHAEKLKADLQSRLDAVDGLSKAIENLNRASVLRVVLLKSRTSRPFELPDPVRPEQSWRLHFRTSGLGSVNPWIVEWSYEKRSASSVPVEGKPLRIDRLLDGGASGPLEGTPFSYRLDLAYHASLADDFIALSISTPTPPR